MYSVLYSVPCTVYCVQRTVYSVQCIIGVCAGQFFHATTFCFCSAGLVEMAGESFPRRYFVAVSCPAHFDRTVLSRCISPAGDPCVVFSLCVSPFVRAAARAGVLRL